MSGYQVSVIAVAVFDTKPYDGSALQQDSANHSMDRYFLDFCLTQDTASASKNARVARLFVNDQLNWRCLEILSRQRVVTGGLSLSGVQLHGYRSRQGVYANRHWSSCLFTECRLLTML
jgi:hypothetical protein